MANGALSTYWEAYGLEQVWQMVCDEHKAATISWISMLLLDLMYDVPARCPGSTWSRRDRD